MGSTTPSSRSTVTCGWAVCAAAGIAASGSRHEEREHGAVTRPSSGQCAWLRGSVGRRAWRPSGPVRSIVSKMGRLFMLALPWGCQGGGSSRGVLSPGTSRPTSMLAAPTAPRALPEKRCRYHAAPVVRRRWTRCRPPAELHFHRRPPQSSVSVLPRYSYMSVVLRDCRATRTSGDFGCIPSRLTAGCPG